VDSIAKSDSLYRLLDSTLIPFANKVRQERSKFQHKNGRDVGGVVAKYLQVRENFEVLNGPFKGLAYPSGRAFGSAIVPKLLGSYERELHAIVESLFLNSYEAIIDVGCAEGYYAVGFAIRHSAPKYFAFDSDPTAIDLCRRMAIANFVEHKFVFGNFCDSGVLCSIAGNKRCLIVCDCEGFEKELFSRDAVKMLGSSDILVETHDCFDIEISTELRRRFELTHEISAVRSVDDIDKALEYDYTELSQYSLLERKQLLSEGRCAIMQWLYLKPKNLDCNAAKRGL
jgi:hypothetical protein